MYQVIARKYRPQSFADVVNQEHVKTTLENAIAQNRIAHGYIFSGQRGTGKTTVARILARCLNCVNGPTNQPCGVCASCKEIAAGGSPDVIEIDAASNRGINEMRELRENVRYQPARDRYKVFIIDEAHQITNEAFNALLKTIEEPPAWAVFMLCTTEAHKIPATIASRCQHFSFRSVEFEALVARMAWICEQEGITADAEALSVLAQAGEGSVRDSLSALDQAIACCGDTLQAAEVRALLGAFSLDALGQVSQALVDASAARMLEVVNELERNGQNLQHFSRELARYFRNLLVAKIAGGETRLIAASAGERQRLAAMAGQFSEEDLTRYLQLSLDLFRDLQFSLQPRFHLELGLLRMVQAGRLVSIEEALAELGPGSAGTRRHGDAAKPATVAARPAPSVQNPAPSPSSWRQRLHASLMELGMEFTADAIEHSEVVEANGELRFTTPREFSIAMKEADINQAVRQIIGKPLKIKVTIGEVAAQNQDKVAAAPATQQEDDVSRRALANPEVQSFRDLFGGEVRTVRNLKE
ncbi:MAG TPA: DNA polymerase III subunit gamma/tau [Bryobacteraceae bacterium]|jgi:DNA polymerase III subunit gamma/tau|nr:DNA polymerase III subunit gamma/tau [Bryobacteraceae bacterium]